MSLANSNSQGNKKKNMPWQFRMLKVLGSVASAVAPIAGLATEATLQSVLAALQDGQEFEQKLVRDMGDAPSFPTYLEIRIWNTESHSFEPPRYFDANGAEFFVGGNPIFGPLEYVNPIYILERIYADTSDLVNWTNEGQQASAASAPVVLSTEQEAILSAIAASTAQIDLDVSDVLLAIGVSNGHLTNLVTWTSAGQLASAASAPVVLSTEQEAILDAIKTAVEAINLDTDGLAQEATLLATNALLTTIDAVLDAIKIDTSNLDTPLSNVEANTAPATGLTPSLSRVTDAVGVLAGARSVSFYNAGTADVTVAGDTLKQGEMITFDAGGINNTLGAIAYDATGGGGRELVITEVR